MYFHPGVMVWNFDQNKHKNVQNVHFNVIVAFLEVVNHQRHIMKSNVFTCHEHRTFIEEVKADVKASPL